MGDDAAGVGGEAEVASEGRVACDHAALGAGLVDAGHGVADDFDVGGAVGSEEGAEALEGVAMFGGEVGEVGVDGGGHGFTIRCAGLVEAPACAGARGEGRGG